MPRAPLLVLFLLCSSLVLQLAFVHAQKFSVPASDVKDTYCRRRIEKVTSDSGYTVAFRALKACRSRTSDSTFGDLLVFGINSRRVPIMGFEAYRRAADATSATASTRVRFVVDRLVEYVEKNNVPGFQPGEDTLVAQLRLFSSVSTPWSLPDVKEETVTVDGVATKVYTLTSKITRPHTHVSEISYGVLAAENAVTVEDPSGTTTALSAEKKKVTVSPSSIKTTFTVRNITYTQPSGTQLAIGTLLFTKRGAIPRSSGTTVPAGTPLPPDEAKSGEQDVIDLESESEGEPGRGFFSYQTFVAACTTATGCTPSEVPLVIGSPKWNTTAADNVDDDTTGAARTGPWADYTMRRIWLSPQPNTASKRVYDLIWDPSSGYTEAPVGKASAASSTAVASAALLASTLLAALALLL